MAIIKSQLKRIIEEEVQTPKGLTFIGSLQLLLIGLKLGSIITWSWGQVLLPFFVVNLVEFGFMAFKVWKSRG